MDVIYGLIPSMIIIGIILVVILFWAIKSGQFDDLEGDAHRILMDEDLTPQKKEDDSSIETAEGSHLTDGSTSEEQKNKKSSEQADKSKESR